MKLARKVKDLTTVDEKYRDLYTEAKEKDATVYVLTEIEDHDAPDKLRAKNTENGALRIENTKFKGQLASFEGVDVEKVSNALVELEAAHAEIEVLKSTKTGDTKAIDKAVEARLKVATTPLETKLTRLQTEFDKVKQENTNLLGAQTTRTIQDEVQSAFVALKVNPSVYQGEDADGLLWAGSRFHIVESKVIDKKTGLPPKDLLEQMRDEGQRTHWFGETSGTNSSAPGDRSAPVANPWMPGNAWNPMKQSEIQGKDPVRAQALANQAGCPDMDAAYHPKDNGPREISRW